MKTESTWHGASFAEAALAVLREGAQLSLVEKLRWIEEAEEFGLPFQRRRWQAGLGVDPRFIDHLKFEGGEKPWVAPRAVTANANPAAFRPPLWFSSLEA